MANRTVPTSEVGARQAAIASWLDVYSEGGEGSTPIPTSEAGARQAAAASWLDVYADGESVNYAERFLDSVSPILAPVFDFLSRGQYASANFAETILDAMPEESPAPFDLLGTLGSIDWGKIGQIPQEIRAGLTGEKKGDYIDIAHERLPESWPDWLKSALGFAGNIFLDPSTYLGIGAVTKTGGRSLLSVAGRGLDQLPGVLGRVGRAVDSRVFGGIEKAVSHIRETKAGQWLQKHFSSRGRISDEQLWRRYQLAKDEAEWLIQKAIERNVPLEKAVQDIEKNLGVPRDVLMDLIERPRDIQFAADGSSILHEWDRLSAYPEEVGALVDQFATLQASRVAREQAAGIAIQPFQSDLLEYMGHYLTPEARKHIKNAKGTGGFTPKFRSFLDQKVQHPSTNQRVFLRDLSVAQINELGRKGELIPGYSGPIFRDDPVMVNTIRDILSARATAAANFIRDVIENPDWALSVRTADDVKPSSFTFQEPTPLGVEFQPPLRPRREGHPFGPTQQIRFQTDEGRHGVIFYSVSDDGKDLYVDFIGPNDSLQNIDLGASGIRELIGELAERFPEAETIIAERHGREIQWSRSDLERMSLRRAEEVTPPPTPEIPEGWRELSPSARERFGPLVEGVVFREDIADALDRYVQKVFDPEHLDEFWRQYDRWLGVWKSYTLGTSPSWMANNILGNLWNGFFLADASPDALRTAYQVMRRGRERFTYKVKPGDTLSQIAKDYNVPIERLMEANNIRNPNLIFAGDELLIPEPVGTIAGRTEAEVLDLAERLGVTFRGLYGGEIRKTLEEQLGRGGAATAITSPVKPVFQANQVFENWTRLGLFIDGLQKGMSPEDAAFRVKKFLFDYTDLSETEQQVFKRIAPFYTWMRKNLPLQVEYFVTEPGKFATIPKAMSAVSSTLEDPQPGYTLPQWMQEGLYVQTGEPAPGISEFTSLRGLPPADMIDFLVDLSQGKVPGSLLSANPAINALFALQGYDTFAEREIDPNARSRIIPGITVKDQTLQVLESLFPPIGVASRFSDPYISPLLPERSTAERIIPQLLGLTQYHRSMDQDLKRTFDSIDRQLRDIESKMEDAYLQGKMDLFQAYQNDYWNVVQRYMDLAERVGK